MLKLYNTLTRQTEDFTPINGQKVSLYSCGPTVYNYAHIGNLRTYIFSDVLRRTLEFNNFDVQHVMNITDVGHLTSDADTGEDKMEAGAAREGKTVWEIASYYTDAFKNDLEHLHILEPKIWAKATDHIEDQIEQVKKIEHSGFAYKTSTGIYFDTSKLPDYGKLARLDIKGLEEGARVEADPEKRNPTDFALWKLSTPQSAHPEPAEGSRENTHNSEQPSKRLMEWDSPWGRGFPGWHIECSAMSGHFLEFPFDIHTGGVDHIPVHHTNEIAQVQGAEGKDQANVWMHGEFLVLDKGRMGKSEGNFITLQTLIDKGYDPLSYRYFTYSAHYRKQLTFSYEALDASATAYKKLTASVSTLGQDKGNVIKEFQERFRSAINDDLNMPQALATTWDLLKSNQSPADKQATVEEFEKVLGLGLSDLTENTLEIPTEVQTLLDQRQTARDAKDFPTSDTLRDQIAALGYTVEDTPDGQKLSK